MALTTELMVEAHKPATTLVSRYENATSDEYDEILKSVRETPSERRRRAPIHYWSKADNARLVARVLWDATDATYRNSVEAINYSHRPRHFPRA